MNSMCGMLYIRKKIINWVRKITDFGVGKIYVFVASVIIKTMSRIRIRLFSNIDLLPVLYGDAYFKKPFFNSYITSKIYVQMSNICL